jgi:transposase-like protein
MVQGRTSGLSVELTPEARSHLESWQRCTTLKAGLAKRARAVLLRYEGVSISQISRTVGLRRRFVEKWIKRFKAEGIEGLSDRPGRGRKPFFPS